jgi:HEAT repeat protein
MKTRVGITLLLFGVAVLTCWRTSNPPVIRDSESGTESPSARPSNVPEQRLASETRSNLEQVVKSVHFDHRLSEIRIRLKQTDDLMSAIESLEALFKSPDWPATLRLIASTPFEENEIVLQHWIANAFAANADSAMLLELVEIYSRADTTRSREQLASLLHDVRNPALTSAVQTIVENASNAGRKFQPLLSNAAAALAAMGDPTVMEGLIERIATTADGTRSALNAGLSNARGEKLLPLLTDIVREQHRLSTNRTAQLAAIGIVSQIHSEKARDLLLELRNAKDPEIAAWANESLQRLTSATPLPKR